MIPSHYHHVLFAGSDYAQNAISMDFAKDTGKSFPKRKEMLSKKLMNMTENVGICSIFAELP